MAEGNGGLYVRIGFLFKWQADIAAYRAAPAFKSAPVGSFHNTRAAARHGSKTHLGDLPAKLTRGLVVRVVFFKPRRAEHRYTGPHKMQRTESFDEFGKNLVRE